MTLIENDCVQQAEPLIENDCVPEECVICLDPMEEYTYYRFDCGHKMHKWCFRGYFSYHYDIESNFLRCPVCSAQISFVEQNEKWTTILIRQLSYCVPIVAVVGIYSLAYVFVKDL